MASSSKMSSTFCLMDLPEAVNKRPDYMDSWVWGKFLTEVKDTEAANDKDMIKAAVTARAFKWHVLNDVMEYMINEENLLVQCEVTEHKQSVEQPLRCFWPARPLKVAGYRILCRWAGASDDQHDFWVNIVSSQMEHFHQREDMMFQPPYYMANEWLETKEEDEEVDDVFYRYNETVMDSVNDTHTLSPEIINKRNYKYQYSKFEVGQRLELLDYQDSGRVRPARVMEIIGRRVCLQVLPEDCPIGDDEDKQVLEDTFWIDEASFYVFHVGWAAYNNYGCTATEEYLKYTQEIAKALKDKQKPKYKRGDVTYEQMQAVKQFPKNITHGWKKGMKLELLDPLDVKLQEFQVATVLEILKDGYLLIGRDDSDPAEAIPLHGSSPLLFPVGYASRFGINLNAPEGAEAFSWPSYLETTNAERAALVFFKKNTTAERAELFQVGAKLEAADLCENKGVCPATIVAKKGRLLHLKFDGWDESFDQLFDIDSKDLFPIGWCEMMGMMLSWPQNEMQKD